MHSYFNPYGTPYDAYINYMNVLADFRLTLDAASPLDPGTKSAVLEAPEGAWACRGPPEANLVGAGAEPYAV